MFGKYRIIKVIGEGSSCTVYLVEYMMLGVKRAIKQVKRGLITEEIFYQEVNILKRLKHQFIPILYDIEKDDEFYYIVEEYLPGESLAQLLSHQKQISQEEIVTIALQLCNILEYLLEATEIPILYLDIQPNNIIYKDGSIYLIDFGCASFATDLENKKNYYGTVGFASPEQYEGSILKESSDIYSLGALMYYLCVGNRILNIKILDFSVLTHISDSFKRVICQCMNYHIHERYETISEVKEQLMLIQKNELSYITDNESQKILIIGTKTRVGTTHFAIALTSYLSKTGVNAVYIEKNNSGHVMNMVSKLNMNRRREGFYYFKDCNMVPLYNDTIAIDMYGYTQVIDGGVYNSSINVDNCKIFIVSGAKQWEEDGLEVILQDVSIRSNAQVIYNMADEKLVRTENARHKVNGIRMPYCFDPFEEDYILNKFFNNLFDKEIRGNRVGIKKKIRQKLKGKIKRNS